MYMITIVINIERCNHMQAFIIFSADFLTVQLINMYTFNHCDAISKRSAYGHVHVKSVTLVVRVLREAKIISKTKCN